MEELEPWNMFTTGDIVAEETDELLTDALSAAYDAPLIDTKVKEEPLEAPEDNDDDDTIFNFGFEPQVQISEITTPAATLSTHTPTSTPTPTNDYNEDSSSQQSNNYNQTPVHINYESAVVYICPACGSEFNQQDGWKRHMHGMHSYNTRRGLNFIQLDKLYHECLECHKRIAMHSMENLLKHKFTHLPYRCTKCKVCLRQYKYRQDLMVHLRMTHHDDLLAIAKSVRAEDAVQHNTAYYANNRKNIGSGAAGSSAPSSSTIRLAIKDIKENATDIFENTCDNIEVKNELIEPDEDEENDIDAMAEQTSNSFQMPSFLEDALSRSSSHASERQSGCGGGVSVNEGEICEKYIQYICPQCGTEYETHTLWRQHIESIHDFGTRQGLNFKEINMNLHAQCLECQKIILVNVIHNLQLHKFTHLAHKSWLRCKLCFGYFVGHKEIVKHLMKQHRLGNEPDEVGVADESQGIADVDEGDNQLLTEYTSKDREERDACEPHIEYLCPQCGKEFRDKKLWRKHIVYAHHLTDLQVLNFKVINDRQVMCLECDKVITNAYGIQNAQQHRITHMPYKAFIRCRLCGKSYTDRKGLVKHLRTRHFVGEEQQLGAAVEVASPQLHAALRQMPPLQPKPPKDSGINRQREIVKHANYTYEIQYLDDDDDVGILDDSATVPELGFGSNNRSFNKLPQQMSHIKCADCGSLFGSNRLLKEHMREEHEFLTYPQNTPKRSRFSQADEQSNDAGDELLQLMPTAEENVNNSGPAIKDSNIERNFCYLCPACGLEYKAQFEWRCHINDAHNFDKRHYLNFRPVDKYRYQCTICKDVVSNSKLKGLQDHKFRHLPYKLYIKCLLCGTCYNHKPNMMSHLRMRHNLIDARITSNTSQFDYDYLQQQQQTPQGGRPIVRATSISSSTPLSTTSTGGLPKPPGLKTVEDCISYHNAVDHETVTYFCPQCNEPFDTHVFWRKHIVDEHNLNSRQGLNFRQIDEHHYLCLECYKRVTVTHTKGAIGQLQSHKFRHLPYKSFKCTACNGEFVRKQMFFKHLNKATNRCEQPQVNSVDDMPLAEPEQSMIEGDESVLPADTEDDGTKGQQPSGTNEALILNQPSFNLICPQCGQQFDSQRPWREHINIEHDLGKRAMLNFKKLHASMHQCLECGEHVSGNKLRDLQTHKFKHLMHGAYIQCRFCEASYYHIRNMQDHLRNRHPNVVQKHEEYAKMQELQDYEENSLNDVTDILDPDAVDMEQIGEVEEIEEPVPVSDDDEQYLLG